MSVESIARSLAFINWVVLVALAVGTLAALLLVTHRAEATRGYRGFAVFAAGGWAFLAWLADAALPSPDATAPIRAAGAEIDGLRRALLVLVALLSTLWALRIARGGDGRGLAAGARQADGIDAGTTGAPTGPVIATGKLVNL